MGFDLGVVPADEGGFGAASAGAMIDPTTNELIVLPDSCDHCDCGPYFRAQWCYTTPPDETGSGPDIWVSWDRLRELATHFCSSPPYYADDSEDCPSLPGFPNPGYWVLVCKHPDSKPGHCYAFSSLHSPTTGSPPGPLLDEVDYVVVPDTTAGEADWRHAITYVGGREDVPIPACQSMICHHCYGICTTEWPLEVYITLAAGTVCPLDAEHGVTDIWSGSYTLKVGQPVGNSCTWIYHEVIDVTYRSDGVPAWYYIKFVILQRDSQAVWGIPGERDQGWVVQAGTLTARSDGGAYFTASAYNCFISFDQIPAGCCNFVAPYVPSTYVRTYIGLDRWGNPQYYDPCTTPYTRPVMQGGYASIDMSNTVDPPCVVAYASSLDPASDGYSQSSVTSSSSSMSSSSPSSSSSRSVPESPSSLSSGDSSSESTQVGGGDASSSSASSSQSVSDSSHSSVSSFSTDGGSQSESSPGTECTGVCGAVNKSVFGQYAPNETLCSRNYLGGTFVIVDDGATEETSSTPIYSIPEAPDEPCNDCQTLQLFSGRQTEYGQGGIESGIYETPEIPLCMADEYLSFDATSDDIVVLVHADTDTSTWQSYSGILGDAMTYTLPSDAIIYRNTAGFLISTNNGGTCQKTFNTVGGYPSYTYAKGVTSNHQTGAVVDMELGGWQTREWSQGVNRTELMSRGWVSSGGVARVKFVLIVSGAGHFRVNGITCSSTPPSTTCNTSVVPDRLTLKVANVTGASGTYTLNRSGERWFDAADRWQLMCAGGEWQLTVLDDNCVAPPGSSSSDSQSSNSSSSSSTGAVCDCGPSCTPLYYRVVPGGVTTCGCVDGEGPWAGLTAQAIVSGSMNGNIYDFPVGGELITTHPFVVRAYDDGGTCGDNWQDITDEFNVSVSWDGTECTVRIWGSSGSGEYFHGVGTSDPCGCTFRVFNDLECGMSGDNFNLCTGGYVDVTPYCTTPPALTSSSSSSNSSSSSSSTSSSSSSGGGECCDTYAITISGDTAGTYYVSRTSSDRWEGVYSDGFVILTDLYWYGAIEFGTGWAIEFSASPCSMIFFSNAGTCPQNATSWAMDSGDCDATITSVECYTSCCPAYDIILAGPGAIEDNSYRAVRTDPGQWWYSDEETFEGMWLHGSPGNWHIAYFGSLCESYWSNTSLDVCPPYDGWTLDPESTCGDDTIVQVECVEEP